MVDGKVHIYNGKVLLDNGKVALCDADCCTEEIECAYCENETGPEQFSVVVANVLTPSPPPDCSSCADCNDTFVLMKDGTAQNPFFYNLGFFDPNSWCQWGYSITPWRPCVTHNWGTLFVELAIGEKGNDLRVAGMITFHTGLMGYYIAFLNTGYGTYPADKVNCTGMSGESISYDSTFGLCDASNPPSFTATAV